MHDRIDKLFSEQELIEFTQELIKIPSHTLYENREKDVANFLMRKFQEEGIDCILQPADGDRCNVIATLHGKGSGKSLMLNGHMDTVPVSDMKEPFSAKIENGIMHGRGTTDMKSGLAAMAYSTILVKRSGIELDGDLVFAGVIDEEAAKSTGSRIVAVEGPKTDFAIVGEPTALYPVTAHNGIDYFEISFEGKSAHSSKPENGSNAIYAAADFITSIKKELVPQYNMLHHPLTGHPTINVGLISGAAKINKDFLLGKSETFAGVVPDEASAYIDVRWTPYQSLKKIEDDLNVFSKKTEAENPGVKIKINYIPLPRPAMEISKDAKLTKAILKNIGEVSPETSEIQGVTYFADSGILFGVGNIQSMIFGPGDIAVAHSPNEIVKVSEIIKAAKIYAYTILDVCCN